MRCTIDLRNAAWACENAPPSNCGDLGVAKTENDGGESPIIIKKYANRRLYNTATSSYVTLDHLAQMVKDGEDFQVFDAKSGQDITRSVLTQIIFEAEGKGQHLLPISFLRRLIKFYGDSLQSVVPSYLDMSMDSFMRHQDQMRAGLQDTLGEPFKQFDEINRRNMEAFQKAISMFNPFANLAANAGEAPAEPQAEAPPAAKEPTSKDEIATLKHELDDMRKQLDRLLKKQD